MLQRNGDKTASSLVSQRDRTYRGDRDALLEEKDRIIAELKERVALLRSELEDKDAVLSRIAEDIGGLPPARVSGADGPRTVALRAAQDGKGATDAQEGQGKPERAPLPDGYRLVAVASDAWVLVTSRGLRVAGYRGELDLRKAALDAREHRQRE